MIPSSHPLVFLRLLLLVVPPESEGEAPAGVRPPVPSLAMQEQRARRPLENPQRSHRSDPLVLPGRSLLCWAFCVKTLPARASQRHVKRQGAWSVDCKVQILGVVVFSSGLGLAEALARLFLMVKLAHLWPCYCLSTHFLIVLFFFIPFTELQYNCPWACVVCRTRRNTESFHWPSAVTLDRSRLPRGNLCDADKVTQIFMLLLSILTFSLPCYKSAWMLLAEINSLLVF